MRMATARSRWPSCKEVRLLQDMGVGGDAGAEQSPRRIASSEGVRSWRLLRRWARAGRQLATTSLPWCWWTLWDGIELPDDVTCAVQEGEQCSHPVRW